MKKALVAIMLLFLFNGCSVNTNSIYHDEHKAIDVANLFLLNLIKEDYKTAYSEQISDIFKNSISIDQFASGLEQMLIMAKEQTIHG